MTSFNHSLDIPATPEQVFAAISTPERLARWWGPNGFTNTFSEFDFKTAGKWSLVMHGPNGANYPNENVFGEIVTNQKVVVEHPMQPVFRLTIELAPSKTGTIVSWAQAFESAEVAKQIEHIVVPANDENLQRLMAEVLGEHQVNAENDTLEAHIAKMSIANGSGALKQQFQGIVLKT